jgi:hypothetical protein
VSFAQVAGAALVMTAEFLKPGRGLTRSTDKLKNGFQSLNRLELLAHIKNIGFFGGSGGSRASG